MFLLHSTIYFSHILLPLTGCPDTATCSTAPSYPGPLTGEPCCCMGIRPHTGSGGCPDRGSSILLGPLCAHGTQAATVVSCDRIDLHKEQETGNLWRNRQVEGSDHVTREEGRGGKNSPASSYTGVKLSQDETSVVSFLQDTNSTCSSLVNLYRQCLSSAFTPVVNNICLYTS